jgi:3-dehydroquinate synthase
VVLTDEHSLKSCYPKIKPLIGPHEVIDIRSGEIRKNLDTCKYIWEKMTNHHIDRRGMMINLGGGVIGDMGGFCAATYKRGISFMNIPTTLLAQVDASLGGKLGIDFKGYKNHIGLFEDPDVVLIDKTFLETLPERELRSGFAEIMKHHLIRDKEGWEALKDKPWKETITNETIEHSISIKSEIVTEDPMEDGLRKILNYGHTLGHALESHFLDTDRSLLHGEAIAAGIILENIIAEERGMLDSTTAKEIREYILDVFGKVQIIDTDMRGITAGALHDKKNKDGQIRSVLLKDVGDPLWDQGLNLSEIRGAINDYRQL